MAEHKFITAVVTRAEAERQVRCVEKKNTFEIAILVIMFFYI